MGLFELLWTLLISQLYSILSDGTRRAKLTDYAKSVRHPVCSPDAKKIVFQLGGTDTFSTLQSEIYSMNIDGSGLTNLSNNPVHDKVAAFSPDGTCSTFQSFRDGNFALYCMRPDGSGQTSLTNQPAKGKRSTWAPDGSRICCLDFRNGHCALPAGSACI